MARAPEAITELRRALGAALRRYREASPLDQTAIGKITAYSRTSISHIEAGRQFPGRVFWQTADQALEANGELLAHFDRVVAEAKRVKIAELQGARVGRNGPATQPRFPGAPHDDDWQRDDVNRRELLRLVTVTGSLLAIPALDIDRIRHAAEHPRRLAPVTVDTYERLNAELWTKFAQSRSKRDVLPAAREQLATLHASLHEPQGADVRRRLCALTGDLFQLCGEIFFDGDSYEDAARCYAEAAHVSKEAREFDLWACAMTRHSFIGIYERQYKQASSLLDGATQLAVRGNPSRTTRFWVAAVQAQTQAGFGNLSACQRALDKAEQVADLDAKAPATGWLRFEGSRLDEERGACYVTLRRPDLAEPALNKALLQATSARRRGSVLTDLATVGAQRGDVDQLLMNGAAAMDSARQTASVGYLGRKLGDLREHLVPYLGDRHVRYLDSQIRDVVTTSAPRQ
ncbi:helix-turn-helix domain-containing protein [Saccharopolyspora phatthalungensis]|uniref:Tetratricopeptide (TPR) repeat protein n=1 Tax=Saccharopolyspora phatthalungensis TaxID=664693 RepID=A0A840QK36_9PSEU|nr:helix-turn-helix transcriptional regulator [Saccharopolyspora phatthalungensis]MBB5159699.1 tetratricopeptide (TPR) repeat protein [Saccharopolyspora phatthalungensis]